MNQPPADRQGEYPAHRQDEWNAQPSAVQPFSGQRYSPQPHPGQPYSGQLDPAQLDPAQPYPGQPYPGQPHPGQLHPGQAFPVPAAGGRLVSAGGRLGASLLDLLLVMVTLGIGFLIWSMITWSDGQTPAKRLLGHVVVDANTGVPFDWGRMALRQFVIQGLLAWVLNFVTLSVYFWVDSLMILGDGQRTLHDRMANSVVRFV